MANNKNDIPFGKESSEEAQVNETKVEANISSPSVMKMNFSSLAGKKIAIVKYSRVKNNKPSEFYYTFVGMCKHEGKPCMFKTWNGCNEIKRVCKIWEDKGLLRNGDKTPIVVTVERLDLKSYYFKEYVQSVEDLTHSVAEEFNLDLSVLD